MIVNVVVPGIALSVAAAYIYKTVFSATAKKCKGKGGEELKKCMTIQRATAEKATIRSLVSAKFRCSKKKDPAKCRKQVEAEVSKRKKRLERINTYK